MKNKKILVLSYTHTLSHLSRPLALAQGLAQSCHLVFASDSAKRGLIEEYGFETVAFFEPDPDYLFGNIRRKNLRFVSREVLELMVHEDLRVIDRVRPDLVLSDGRFSAPISCQVKRVKHAAIVNVSSTAYRAIPYLPYDNLFYRRDNNGLRLPLCQMAVSLEALVFDHVMSVFLAWSRRCRLAHKVTATNCLTGVDLTLLADVPEYFPVSKLPPGYHFIGPLTWKPPRSLEPDWWPPEKTGHGLIYFSLGSTGETNLFQDVYELIKDSPYQAIIATGQESSGLEPIKGKIYVVPYIDGDQACQISDLVICHGGNGTIYQALMHGKPVLGIPSIPDQDYNMRRVERLGLGIKLPIQELSKRPSMLLQGIKHLLEDKEYPDRARAFQRILTSYQQGRRKGIEDPAELIIRHMER